MKRSVLFAALLLSVLPAGAESANYGTITTRYGKSYHECQFMHLYPDGVTFTHKDGAVKIPFAELPESLCSKFRYNPKAEAEYQKQQAELRKAAQERQKLQDIAMQEAKLAEANRLAATSAAVASVQTPSWAVGSPVTSLAARGRSSSRGSYSRLGYSGSRYYSGGYSSGINYGHSYVRHPSYGGFSGHIHRPTVSVPSIHIGIGTGGSSFCGSSFGGGGFGIIHHHQ